MANIPIYEDDCILYYAINSTEACAVLAGPYCADIKKSVSSCLSDNNYTVKVVFICSEAKAHTIYIPDTVESIYGSENLSSFSSEYPKFEIDDNHPYFEYRANNNCLFSKDGEDLIYGRFDGNFDSALVGVKTIHKAILRENTKTTLVIPASITKINKLEGTFTNVTFEGSLPTFEDKALENAEINTIEVYTPKDESSPDSVNSLMRVSQIGGVKYSSYRRPEEKTLFLSHTITDKNPKANGYIALTRAEFDHDGETILINTQWIASISPKKILRTDGENIGSALLVGLKGERQECCGITYYVYESLEEIDNKIATIQ